MRNVIFVSIIFLIIFSSCRKRERTTKVNGTVIDYGSKEPIEDVKLIFMDGISTNGPISSSNFSSGKEIVGFSDQNGKFDLELTGEFSPYLFFGRDDYWPYEDGNGITSSAIYYSKGSVNEGVEIILKSKAWFASVFKNKNSSLDSMYFQPLSEKLENAGSAGKKYFFGSGPFDVNFGINRIANGNSFFRYLVGYIRNNKWHEKIDSVYIKKGEIYRDTIYY